MRRLFLVFGVGVLHACQCGTSAGLHDYACGTSEDCATGYLCFEQLCITRDEFFKLTLDAGTDAGPEDSGIIEYTPDGGDGGVPDAGPPDAGSLDAGEPDAGPPDAGSLDAGEPDAGSPDAGCDAGTVELCTDGVDNNCNALVDCAESSCGGRTCGANGRVCSGTSCVCSGNGGMAQASETSCSDGFDNDCDGLIDCADSSCAAQSCGANGLACSGTACACSGNGGTAQTSEAACSDAHDNDCDGLIDCADSQCAGLSCGTNGRVCSGTSCACSGNGGTAQASETTCSDAHDNDCDGLIDCADAQCAGLSCGTNGRVCSGTSCACSGNGGTAQASETTCSDAHDNDCDGLTDCADSQCAGLSCGTNGRVCSGTSCACSGNGGTAQAAETSCSDGFDNDCDGLVDMADPNCVPVTDGGTYVISTSPQTYVDACTQTGFTRHTFANPDDEATPVLALPIPFSFYGVPVSQYWFSTNGMIGFSATPSSTLASACLPATSNPKPGIYVFLDDLVTSNGLCTVVTGTAPNRKLIITWPAVDSFNYGPVNMNFSAFLSETTNTVDIVFGSMPSNNNTADARGLDALTGVANTAGDRATQYACHQNGYAVTGLAIRFTPQ